MNTMNTMNTMSNRVGHISSETIRSLDQKAMSGLTGGILLGLTSAYLYGTGRLDELPYQILIGLSGYFVGYGYGSGKAMMTARAG